MRAMPEASTHVIGTCMAFDYGTRHIGMSVGDYRIKSSRPLAVIKNQNGTPDWQAITNQIQQWQPTDLVLGWPLTEEGDEQPLCDHIKGFAKRLRQRYALPIHYADERFSSMEAQEHIRQMRSTGQRSRRSKHTDVDSVAAALILERWFNHNKA